MKGFAGNKTLLPLLPGGSPFEGAHPLLLHILDSLPPGPKAVVVHHRKAEIIAATRNRDLSYCEQHELNGTGGALLAARPFLEKQGSAPVLITMGDVPLVKPATYRRLIDNLRRHHLVVLAFRPEFKKQYGLLDIAAKRVRRIIEWKYWKDYPAEMRRKLTLCNSGIYAARGNELLRYLSVMASLPHKVTKEIDGALKEKDEFFITDLVEQMARGGLSVGYREAEDEEEVMGIDDAATLRRAQAAYGKRECAPQDDH